jgi:hypothetical protein
MRRGGVHQKSVRTPPPRRPSALMEPGGTGPSGLMEARRNRVNAQVSALAALDVRRERSPSKLAALRGEAGFRHALTAV